MAVRIGEYVEWGVLYHSRRNATHGYVKLCGHEAPIHIDLTGDPGIELHGKALRFEPGSAPELAPVELPKDLRVLHPHQVGPTGYMTINRGVRTFPGHRTQAIIELVRNREPLPPSVWKRCLTLEWYSQNGRVLIEMPDPQLWIADYRDAANEDDESVWKVPPEPESWERAVETSAAPPDEGPRFEGLADENEENGWYPGCERRDEAEMSEEEFIREMELMDDCVTGEIPGDSLRSFVTECVPSGPLDQLTGEEAEAALKSALASLALRGVAVHICEHYSTHDSLLYLRTVVADEGEYHPQLARTTWTQNFMTSEGCPLCEEKFEREYREREARIAEQMRGEHIQDSTGIRGASDDDKKA